MTGEKAVLIMNDRERRFHAHNWCRDPDGVQWIKCSMGIEAAKIQKASREEVPIKHAIVWLGHSIRHMLYVCTEQ
jgi:hypothetical protein